MEDFCNAYRSNDGVAIGILDKVLDSAGRSCVEVIAANEVRWKLMFRLPRAVLPVCQGTVGAVDGGRHCVGLGGDHAIKKKCPKYDTDTEARVKIGCKKS